ncbi:acyl-CoA N-acyltransferase [Phlyctochytrium arcticum]|nr:acyl-CoA N-acyltransferase [Phlyctochytrium arcticum]
MATTLPITLPPPAIPTSPLIFTSPRLLLRTHQPADYPGLLHILSDPTTMTYLPGLGPSLNWTLETIAARQEMKVGLERAGEATAATIILKKQQPKTGPCEVDEGTVIGMCGFRILDRVRREAELGIVLHHVYHGTGLAQEGMYLQLAYAFDVLDLKVVCMVTGMDNVPMQSMLKRMGVSEGKVMKIDPVGNALGGGEALRFEVKKADWENGVRDCLASRVLKSID